MSGVALQAPDKTIVEVRDTKLERGYALDYLRHSSYPMAFRLQLPCSRAAPVPHVLLPRERPESSGQRTCPMAVQLVVSSVTVNRSIVRDSNDTRTSTS